MGKRAVTEQDLTYILMNAMNGTLHSAEEALQNGYLPLPNGCRMGICGQGAMEDGAIRSIRSVSSLCIRMARPAIGCADAIYPRIAEPTFRNTIIIAPPGKGKTTLLRELIRKLSRAGHYVSVADERGELSGMCGGVPTFDLGARCDVSVGVPKQQAAIMLLRGMSPDILAMDEITAARDLPALTEAVGCGVGLLTTMHGTDLSALEKPAFREIAGAGVFQRAVIIRLRNGRREYTVEDLER